MNIIEALEDRELFGRVFGDLASWRAWAAMLKATFGLTLSGDELEVFRRHTGRKDQPDGPMREVWLPTGRRGGKSRVAALVAVFLATFKNYGPVLSPGERGTVMIIAADRRQARVIFRYIDAFFQTIPMLARMIEKSTQEEILLNNGISIEIHTANFRAVRGYTVVACICDEIAYWRSDETSANPDKEILAGIRPGMATIPGALLLCLSSPYSRRGAMWEAYRDFFGKPGDVLVWQAPSIVMNPTLDRRVVDAAYAADESAAAAEFGGEFRKDIESFVALEAIEACVIPNRRELGPIPHEYPYLAFVDPSGGSKDSMTLAIAHHENGRMILDAVRERRPPFSPDDVTSEFAGLLQAYGISTVRGDRYGGEYPRERFREHGVKYEVCKKTKNELYLEFLPLLNSGRVELLDNQRLIAQLSSLERRTARGGKDSVDHPPNAHDDLANVAAGVLVPAGFVRAKDDLGIS